MNDIDRFKPLADASSAIEIGDLEISNDENTLTISGSLRFDPTEESIERAKSLSALLERTANALEKARAAGKSAPTVPTTGTDEFGLPL